MHYFVQARLYKYAVHEKMKSSTHSETVFFFIFQTHKICANHFVTANIDLQPMKNNDKVWIWAAQVYCSVNLIVLLFATDYIISFIIARLCIIFKL